MKSITQKLLGEVDVFLLDMDGTLYLGNQLIGNMPKTLQKLRKNGKKLVYLSNNSSRSMDAYRQKLQKMGLWGEDDAIYSSATATADYLCRNHADSTVHVLGTRALKEEFASRGIVLTDGAADIAVLGYDTELTYAKLCAFTDCLRKGGLYFATHPDINCPTENYPVPDAGAYIAMIEKSVGRTPSLIIGKPNPFMAQELSARLGVSVSRMAMVGDRLMTDMRFALNAGMKSVLVYSGEATEEDARASGMVFDYELSSLNELFE